MTDRCRTVWRAGILTPPDGGIPDRARCTKDAGHEGDHAFASEPVKLTLRAGAVLLCLRRGPRTERQIREAIADERADETAEILLDLARVELIRTVPVAPGLYGLTGDGVAWLAFHGLRVSR